MNTIAMLLATSMIGVDYELVFDGSEEPVYVVTIERELIDQLDQGFTINSTLPENAKTIRQVRIRFSGSNASNTVDLETDVNTPNVAATKTTNSDSGGQIGGTETELLFTPDESLIPQSKVAFDSAAEKDRNQPRLEPEPVVLPELLSDKHSHDAQPIRDLGHLVDNFAESDNTGETNEEFELVKSSPGAVPIDVPEAQSTVNVPSSNPTVPDLINTHADEFVALSSLTTPVEESLVDAPTAAASGRTDLLLLLMFSITLNVFLGITIYRIYRN